MTPRNTLTRPQGPPRCVGQEDTELFAETQLATRTLVSGKISERGLRVKDTRYPRKGQHAALDIVGNIKTIQLNVYVGMYNS